VCPSRDSLLIGIGSECPAQRISDAESPIVAKQLPYCIGSLTGR
jgi:hypothetical protein